MLAAALITFRETLEASLIIAIIMAATVGVAQRNRWVGLGILAGVIASGLIAALAEWIATAASGAGQELMNAGILFTAVAMLSWHVVWMSQHGRELAVEMKKVGHDVRDGAKHMSVLATVIGLAVMREGAEVVLMMQGLLVGHGGAGSMMLGAVIGVCVGALTGSLFYLGMVRLPLHRLFSVTNGLLILIAGGMAARGANFLAQADLLPSLGSELWDSSFILSDQSLLGQFLAALTGYIARPSGIQILFYGTTVIVLTALLRWIDSKPRHTLAA